MRPCLEDLLSEVLALGASDLHLAVGLPPMARVDGRVLAARLSGPYLQRNARDGLWGPFGGPAPAAGGRVGAGPRLRAPAKSQVQGQRLFPAWLAGSRISYHTFGRLGACATWACRRAVEDLTDKPRGLVLVTGPTGSGKSTTLASMVDRINEIRSEHIMSIEDPIEFSARAQEVHGQPARGRPGYAGASPGPSGKSCGRTRT